MLNTIRHSCNWVKLLLQAGVILLITILLLELSYRQFIIEFYASELAGLNDSLEWAKSSRSKILFLGDSFTANRNGYVAKLQKESSHDMINSAVSGTGILEASFMANSRINRFKPSILVYQIYLGNDLLDIRHRPTGEISWTRKIYHSISDHLRIAKLINYRLGQFKATFYKDLKPTIINDSAVFSAQNYSARQKMIFEQEPYHLENVLELKDGRERDFEVLISRLKKIESHLDEDCQLVILIVPHCAQVNNTYSHRMQLVGSKSDVRSNLFYDTFQSEFPECTIVNTLTYFQKRDTVNHRLYLENDPHLSDLGQTVLADILKPYLEEKPSNLAD